MNYMIPIACTYEAMKYSYTKERSDDSEYWNAAIIRKSEKYKGFFAHYGEIICECDEENAELICNALNEYDKKNEI